MSNSGISTLYNSALNVYNLKPYHLRKSRAYLGKARAGVSDFRIAHLGDSTTGGVGASPGTNAWPDTLRTLLANAGYPSNGTGWVAAYKAAAADSQWTIPAAWTGFSGFSNLLSNQTTADALVFTSNIAGTIVDVFYSTNGGPFTVSIDGGAAVAVNPSTSSSIGTYTVTGLANTTHTVSIVRTSGNVTIFAASVRSGSTGVKTYNAGIGGMKANALATYNWWEVVSSTTNPGGGWSFQAHLVTLMCEVNDANGGATPVATYKSQIQTAISQIKTNGSDLILLTAIPSSGVDLSAYNSALYSLASSNDIPLIDLQDRWGTYTASNSYGIMSDGLHPNSSGYADIATAVYNVLGVP